MKQAALFLTLGLLATVSSCSQTTKPAQKELGVFVGSTPCIKGSQPLPGMSQDSDCEFIKWNLKLFMNDKNEPTDYKLEYTYGISQPSTQGFKDGKTVRNEGKWRIVNGNKVVFQLDIDKTRINFIKLSDGLLHLLDTEGKLMVGNPGFSFTLNKVNL